MLLIVWHTSLQYVCPVEKSFCYHQEPFLNVIPQNSVDVEVKDNSPRMSWSLPLYKYVKLISDLK